jgi:hypothetical protein
MYASRLEWYAGRHRRERLGLSASRYYSRAILSGRAVLAQDLRSDYLSNPPNVVWTE